MNSGTYTAADGSTWHIEHLQANGWCATRDDTDGEVNRYGMTRAGVVESVEAWVVEHPPTLGDEIANGIERHRREVQP